MGLIVNGPATAICLRASGNPPTGTVSAAYNTAVYGTQDEAVGISYNTGTGVATIQTAGVYSIMASFMIGGTSAAGGYEVIRVDKNNGTDIGSVPFASNAASTINRGLQIAMTGVRLAANDTIRIKSYSDATTPSYTNTVGLSQFSIVYEGP